MARLLLLLIFIIFFESCKTDSENIKASTEKIVSSIRKNDFETFKKTMNERDYEFDTFGAKSNFIKAQYYINKYWANKQIPYPNTEQEYVGTTEVKIPLFTGFDSLKGVENAVLELDFRLPTPNARYSKLQNIIVHTKTDPIYISKYLKDSI